MTLIEKKVNNMGGSLRRNRKDVAVAKVEKREWPTKFLKRVKW